MDGASWSCTGGSDQHHPEGREMQKDKWLSEETLQKAMKRREAKGKGGKERYTHLNQLSSVVMSDSLWPPGLQQARPPCPSPTPEVYLNSCPLSQWCHPTISFSAVHFSSHLQSFPASGSFPVSQFFTSGECRVPIWMQSSKEYQGEIRKPSSVINAKK